MRTQDVKAIREFAKFVPAFAAFEKNRLSLYREAAMAAGPALPEEKIQNGEILWIGRLC